MKTIRIVETDSARGAYEFKREFCLLDHPKHGRLYVTEGFGGMDSIDGGQYRWRHGAAAKVPADTTLAEVEIAGSEGVYVRGEPCRYLPLSGNEIDAMVHAARKHQAAN